MNTLFQQPIFPTSLLPPPPTSQWRWVIPPPARTFLVPAAAAPSYQIPFSYPSTTSTFTHYVSPIFAYQQQQPQQQFVLQTLQVTQPQPQPQQQQQQQQQHFLPPPPPPPHRVGLVLRAIMHGQRQPGRAPGFWALTLDAAYAQMPTRTQVFRDVAAWAAQHGLVPSCPNWQRRWSAWLYVMDSSSSSSSATGVVLDKDAGCVVVSADRVLRALQLSSDTGGEGDSAVGEALEDARQGRGRVVLVVDFDADAHDGGSGPSASTDTPTAGAVAPSESDPEPAPGSEPVPEPDPVPEPAIDDAGTGDAESGDGDGDAAA